MWVPYSRDGSHNAKGHPRGMPLHVGTQKRKEFIMEYVSKVLLDVNGQSIEDFKSVEEGEIELHKQVNLMNKTGHTGVTPRYGVNVDYVVPETDSEFDWDTVADGRLSIEKMNGKRTTYTGVYVLKVGAAKADGENEMVKTIELGAEGRIPE